VRLLRPLAVSGHPQGRGEGREELSLFETVFLREIRPPFEVAPVERLEEKGAARPERLHHRGPERSVEKPYRDEHVVALAGEGKSGEVARDQAHEPSLRASRSAESAQRLEAPVEGVHRESFAGEKERVPSETAGQVERAAPRKLFQAFHEKRRGSGKVLGVAMLLLPALSF
jgi:hypothetical protein